jgi:phage terminase small subunit
MRGRKPRPNAEKLAKGETRPSRVNYEEPEVPAPSAGALEPPKDLRGAGFRLWRDHAKTMTESGQLRATDMPAFLAHCKTEADIEGWEKELKLKGLDRADRLTIQRTLNQLRSLSLRQAAELGMTSVARSRVKAVTKPPVEKPKHERFFGGIRGVIPGGRK